MAIAVFAIVIVVVQWIFQPAVQYRVFGNHAELRRVLARDVEYGEDLNVVVALLGPAVHRKSIPWIEIQMKSKDAEWYKELYPDGIEVNDEFLAYPEAQGQWVLQFREGKLINFPKDWLRSRYL